MTTVHEFSLTTWFSYILIVKVVKKGLIIMEFKSIDEQVIQKYQEDEQLMIQLFVQWCVNYELDANELYARAYPEQQENASLQKILKEMDDSDPLEIDNETMMDVLQLFGNFDLAFVLSEEIERLSKK